VEINQFEDVKKAAGNGFGAVGAFRFLRGTREMSHPPTSGSHGLRATQAEAAVEALALRAIADRSERSRWVDRWTDGCGALVPPF